MEPALKTAVRIKRVAPLFNRVLIKRADPETQSKGGIMLPESSKNRVLKGTVVAVGPGSRNESGESIPMVVQPGDDVILPDYGGTKVEMDENQVYYMFRESDILAKVYQ
ncbi:hypothetical protein NQ314_008986 [Rhamnusium bicolor]|uniref:10 kDa heat shock protein, mitochondrial n=1 Tax=Rhamnusium bicolor TaxID=1586634 RepID=A0AAV8Y566_9CUCU|nr:hypothetical protein NQ314_008986 [Rhamnusium bicolor]